MSQTTVAPPAPRPDSGRRSRAPWVAALVVLALLAAAATAWLVVRPLVQRSDLERAVAVLPDSTQRVSFTDWTQVAGALGDGVTSGSGDRAMEDFLDRAYDADLTMGSALTSSFPAMEAAYGVTPLDAQWEVYGQGEAGAVSLLRLDDDVDLDEVEGTFADLGYEAPADGAGTDGVWVGTPELVSGLKKSLSPLQMNLAVLGDEHLLVMADDPVFVQTAIDAVRDEGPRLGDGTSALGDVVAAVGEPAAATLWVGDFACVDLAMSQADRSDVATGERLVRSAGGVHPLDGLAFAQEADGGLVMAFGFETDDQAAEDLQPRTTLAGGDAPGQGGSFRDRFEITSSTQDGRVVTMRAKPVADRPLSDVGQGPVLFATC